MDNSEIIVRKFESFNDTTWEEDLLSLYDIFCELEDTKICRIDYQGGYRTSSGSNSYTCFLKNEKIEGDKDHINHMIRVNSRSLLRVSLLEIEYNGGYSPFSQTNAPSFYAEDADIFLRIMRYVDAAKKRMPKYNLGITLDENVVYLDFLENRQ